MPHLRQPKGSSPETNDRIRWQRPPEQRISKKRVQMIQTCAIAAAVALTVYDAYVSYQGFKLLALPNQAPLVLALLILVIQLASGSIQQLGMNPFRGVGGSKTMDFMWKWVLGSVYVIDVGSNAIAFGVPQHLNLPSLQARPFDAVAMAIILLALSALLTFGDEILLRLVDRLVIGSRANDAAAELAGVNSAAYNRYLKEYRTSALSKAERAGKSAAVDFEWLEQGGADA
jgi:hypothetical protein